jgi:thiol-disulfide isomerase/thioredoxin
MNKFCAIVSVALVIVGCQKPIPSSARWHGMLGEHIPFTIELDLSANPPRGEFVNGHERTLVPGIHQHNDSLSFLFTEYGAAMRGVWNGTSWSGKYFRFRSDTSSIAFSATPAVAPAPQPEPTKTLPPVGKFMVRIQRDSLVDTTTLATFWIRGDSLFGTFIAQDGDYGLNVGKQVGDHFELSRFNGWQAMRFELRLTNGVWSGIHQVRTLRPTSFTLIPRPSIPKEIPGSKLTTLKNPKSPFWFSGLLPSGDTLTNLSPQLKGKAVLLDMMGTWCHNCMDEAPLLQELYAEFQKEGLEIVGYSFENQNDFALAKTNLGIYAKRHGLTFPLIFAGDLEGSAREKLHSQLNDFYAYPTVLFIDRKGIVLDIHIGFRGIGTGDEFQQEVKLFYEKVHELLRR